MAEQVSASQESSHENYDYLDKEGKELPEDFSESSGSNTPKDVRYEPINAEDAGVLTRLASQLSRTQSHRTSRSGRREDDLEIAGLDLNDPLLDPASDKFDISKWIRKTLSIYQQEEIQLKRSGLVLKNVNVSGTGSALNLQSNLGTVLTSPLRIGEMFGSKPVKRILRDFNCLLKSGELLIVLGRPGSGCSTLLKSMTGEMHGLQVSKDSVIHYDGVLQQQMMKEFKGEVVYNQEVDKHFPHLTVGETLEHAAAMRTPSNRPLGMSRSEAVKYVTRIVMAVYGLSHTYNTKVGNDFVRGVSGGERKRVSIAEMALAGSPIAAWDNSTRGLDSATALTFTKSLRQSASLTGSSHAIAIYQASQAIYDQFDKAIVLYDGRQIYFGPASRAKAYFEEMGWYCPARQTTGDFLTSVTNPGERSAREGFESKVPRSADDFEAYWRNSPEYQQLLDEIRVYEERYPVGQQDQLNELRARKNEQQANHTRRKSPYVVSVPMQIKLNGKRAWQRIVNDKPATLTPLIGNVIMSLIIGSVFYDTVSATAGFSSFGAVLFFSILLNALSAIAEINSLYSQRPIVEKHKSYAFYHPATEAIAGFVVDTPLKFLRAVAFNLVIYFMTGLRREPSQFFIFFLITFMATFVMSAIFRTLAAVTKTVSQAMSLAGVMVLAIVVYTGFVVPTKYMHPWFGWIRYINPVYYSFEILVANQFHGRQFTCSEFVPDYNNLQGDSFICSATGAVAGERTVSGDNYIAEAYSYYYSHVWRNFGILLAFLFFFMGLYFITVELNSSTTSSAEVLVFRRGHVPAYLQEDGRNENDEEAGQNEKKAAANEDQAAAVDAIPAQTDLFTWRDVVYDIEIKGNPRRLLDNVSGWVKPGTLTALMGTSGAGKTTLLDVLAQRTTMGVITGDMFVNGKPLDSSFQRKTGYVQQQDLHLDTASVRESLRFSAMLRQPASVSKEDKYAYVEKVIQMLGMEDFAEAIVGSPGEGLNVEQRKLLTIGVELAAKPKLLLFLDEPTSGLDSQSAWAICAFLRKLADNGQAVLCTIHQPSAILFQQFDRLLFLRRGGQTVYFGDLGHDSSTLLNYFEANGARKCDKEENPAEYMLEVAADTNHDWHNIWKGSKEAQEVQREIEHLHRQRSGEAASSDEPEDKMAHSEFAMPLTTQLREVTYRVFQYYWRTPSYIIAKLSLTMASGLFIGFSFYAANSSEQGMQDVLYSLFMVSAIFSTLVQQIMPLFVSSRALYEVRERPSKAYSWKAFLFSSIIVEIPYQMVAGTVIWACFYFAVVGADQSPQRQALVWLLCVEFFIFASTFAHLIIAALPDAETAGAVATLLFSLTLIFNGVMQSPTALPGFWIFMYRVSPLTYWVQGIAATMLAGRAITCSTDELSIFNPPSGETCQTYLATYLQTAPGSLYNPSATSNCEYCALTNANQFLADDDISYSQRWRNFGILWAYVIFNIGAATFLYWFFRVRKSSGKSKKPLNLGAKFGGIKQSLKNMQGTKARTNPSNAEVF